MIYTEIVKIPLKDVEKGNVIKTYSLSIPINKVIIADKIKLFD